MVYDLALKRLHLEPLNSLQLLNQLMPLSTERNTDDAVGTTAANPGLFH